MKVEINENVCIGCGLCANFCSECFSLNNEKNKAEVIKNDGCESCDLNEAVGNCPVGAISIEK
ncbi:MAG: ferredoxin [Patescibacteria group bacterium]|jgi:ferredoxin|nr:ferredoxin [Patescibacteria group bacterium]